MAVKIRLARLVVGFYDPLAAKGDARRLGLNVDLVKYWLSVGAQPTNTVLGILMTAGLISPPPMIVMGQKKGPPGETLNPEKSITLQKSPSLLLICFFCFVLVCLIQHRMG
ncbi:hypothetical protein OIU84_027020 [Salix udensis]|uniref:Ribosomal protein S16 n=1 Tax=Salix udensis TaxID=889485 RepID=A0AAD6KEK3_9ROSI|nr:hypothetical protein OIU84_027020 [Salix udensis]